MSSEYRPISLSRYVLSIFQVITTLHSAEYTPSISATTHISLRLRENRRARLPPLISSDEICMTLAPYNIYRVYAPSPVLVAFSHER